MRYEISVIQSTAIILWYLDKFRLTRQVNKTNYNSDGLIKCLRQPGQLQSQPLKSMRENFLPFIEFTAPRLFRRPGQSLRRAAGQRAGALFFARTKTISPWRETSLPSIWTWYRFAASPWPLASYPSTGPDSYRDGKKRGTTTQTAPN